MNLAAKFSETALVVIDFINDIVSEGGKLSGKGYRRFIDEQNTESNVSAILAHARRSEWLIVHVRIGFSESYIEHPEGSPLFGSAKKFHALAAGTWGTEFAKFSMPLDGEYVVEKHRVSAFFGTDLEIVLRSAGVRNLVLCGCATDLAVQSAARDAHDRDFSVTIIAGACAAACISDHEASLVVLQKIGNVVESWENGDENRSG